MSIKLGIGLACLLFASQANAVPQGIAPSVASVLPQYASTVAATMYASTCPVVVNSSTTVSTFCPVSTDPQSAIRRTYPAGSLVPGKAFSLDGGGIFTVPTGNLLSADIILKVGSTTIVSVTTPAAPVGTNAGVSFHADCMVAATATMHCTGVFMFAVLGTTPVIVPFNSVTAKPFNPSVDNVIDVLGDWNGPTSTQSTTVQSAVLTARN